MSRKIRAGYYVKIDGREMKIIRDDIRNNIEILSEDKNDLNNGFRLRKGYTDKYEKILKTEEFKQKIKDGEIGEVYFVSSHGIYREQKVSVHTSANWDGKNVWITTSEANIAYICKMDQVDRSDYIKEVPLSEVKVIETIKLADISKW